MEDQTGIIILATNRKDAIDPAFLRRIRRVISNPGPKKKARRGRWKKTRRM